MGCANSKSVSVNTQNEKRERSNVKSQNKNHNVNNHVSKTSESHDNQQSRPIHCSQRYKQEVPQEQELSRRHEEESTSREKGKSDKLQIKLECAKNNINGSLVKIYPEEQLEKAEKLAKSILDDAELFFTRLPDSITVQQVVALTFMNSCMEVIRTKFRLKIDVITEMFQELTKRFKLTLLESTLPELEERSMDDGFSRLVLAWFSNNPNMVKRISVQSTQAILDTLYIRWTATSPATFYNILDFYFRWVSVNQATLEMFKMFAEGRENMSPEQLGKFLRETQKVEVSDRQLLEKFKYRFGGGIHRYNFASYNGSVLTNSAVDPTRTSDVWQDMTQSFTHYLVNCIRIETELDFKRAMSEGIRTLVLNVKANADGELCSGSCTLEEIADGIKKNGFVTNTYPIILCFSPSNPMTVAVQDAVAALLNDKLGELIAKGLMFEGAAINDPKFSPGALRKRVLVMSEQTTLKPFIGFMVADMIKDGLGVRVTDVIENTPAAKGGVQKDDWFTHVNGKPIRNKQHLRHFLDKLQVGEEFSVKRENLDELKIVVGGVVDANDTSVSAELSNLTFFKWSKSAHPRPWEVVPVEYTELEKSPLNRCELENYLAFVSINSDQAVSNRKHINDYEGIASEKGIQLIDVCNEEENLAWNRGRFYDNGKCGYLLKTSLDEDKLCDLTINVISGPRQLSCPPLALVQVRLYGTGTSRTSGSQITFQACNDASVAVLTMTFDVEGIEHCFVSSFGVASIRAGYRAISCLPINQERALRKTVHSVYCYIKRTVESHLDKHTQKVILQDIAM